MTSMNNVHIASAETSTYIQINNRRLWLDEAALAQDTVKGFDATNPATSTSSSSTRTASPPRPWPATSGWSTRRSPP